MGMKPLSMCTSIVGIADVGLRSVVRELLIPLKLRDIKYVSDTDGINQAFQYKADVDFIVVQDDLPPDGGSLVVAKYVRWGKMSGNHEVPIISIGWEWTPERLLEIRRAGINEVIAMPTTVNMVQRKIVSAIDTKRPFISMTDYRGPCRRRGSAGFQGPFRRAADRLAEQINNALEISERKAEKQKKLDGAVKIDKHPVNSAAIVRRPTPNSHISSDAKKLKPWSLSDFGEKAKAKSPQQTPLDSLPSKAIQQTDSNDDHNSVVPVNPAQTPDIKALSDHNVGVQSPNLPQEQADPTLPTSDTPRSSEEKTSRLTILDNAEQGGKAAPQPVNVKPQDKPAFASSPAPPQSPSNHPSSEMDKGLLAPMQPPVGRVERSEGNTPASPAVMSSAPASPTEMPIHQDPASRSASPKEQANGPAKIQTGTHMPTPNTHPSKPDSEMDDQQRPKSAPITQANHGSVGQGISSNTGGDPTPSLANKETSPSISSSSPRSPEHNQHQPTDVNAIPNVSESNSAPKSQADLLKLLQTKKKK